MIDKREPIMIVSEVSRSWGSAMDTEASPIALLFEGVIETNRKRSYELHSWKFSQVNEGEDRITETIIAVFKKSYSI